MQIKDTARFNSIVETAKAKAANSPAWQRCLDKASKMMASGELVVTLLADGALVTSPNGSYHVTAGHCPCAAKTAHCYHRCAVRIATLLDAEETAPPADAVVVAAFAAKFPGYHFADYLLKFYGQNSLQFMNRDLVADI